MYRVSRKYESGDYIQKDFRTKKAAVNQITKWACEPISMAAENKVTLTIEVYP